MSLIPPTEYSDPSQFSDNPKEYPPNSAVRLWAEEQLLLLESEIIKTDDFVNLRTVLTCIAEQDNCTPQQEQAKIEIARQLGNILKGSCNPVIAIEVAKSVMQVNDKLSIEEIAANTTVMRDIGNYLKYIGAIIGKTRKKSSNIKKQTRAILLAISPNAEIIKETTNSAYQTAIDILQQRQRTIEEL